MADLRAVVEQEIDAVCAFLEASMGRGMTREEYQSLFRYPWLPEKPGLGYVLEENGRIVGFLGAIYSDREIRGKAQRFCNLTNWSVLPEFRGESLRLLFALLGKPGQTVLNLSPSPEVEKMLVALKYRLLDTYKLFSPPFANFWTLFGHGRLVHDVIAIRALLTDAQRKVLDDHAPTGCRFLTIVDGERYSFVVTKRRKKQGLVFSEVLHVSNPALLIANFEKAKLSILTRDRTLMLAIDERLLGSRVPLMLPYRRVSFFQSRAVEASEIDNLYSEIAVL